MRSENPAQVEPVPSRPKVPAPTDVRMLPRILIIEDNYLIAEAVSRIIRASGLALAAARTHSVAKGLAMIAEIKPDAVLLDIDRQGSYPLARALVAHRVPFMFLDGCTSSDLPPEFTDIPLLSRPFTSEALLAALDHLLPSSPTPLTRFGNSLLDALPPPAKVSLTDMVECIELHRGDVLETPGQAIDHVYFPVSCLISVFHGSESNFLMEVSTVGRDGMTAAAMLLGNPNAAGKAIVQFEGRAYRVSARELQKLAEADSEVRRYLLTYLDSSTTQLVGHAAYTRRDTVVQRLARWLSQARHCLSLDRLAITHDALAEILGIRRPSASRGLQALEGERLIRSTRSIITILDPTGLARRAER